MALTFGPTPFNCRRLSGAPDAGAMTGSSTTDPGWTACSGARGGGGMFSASVASACGATVARSEEHTSELQSLMRISYAVFCLKKKKQEHTYDEIRKPGDNDQSTLHLTRT